MRQHDAQNLKAGDEVYVKRGDFVTHVRYTWQPKTGKRRTMVACTNGQTYHHAQIM